MPLPRSIWSAQIRHRSPSRMAADSPNLSGDPDNPRFRCHWPNWTCAAGRPRRDDDASMTSSCSSAKALAAGDEIQQDVAGHLDTGVIQLDGGSLGYEFGDVRQHLAAQPDSP